MHIVQLFIKAEYCEARSMYGLHLRAAFLHSNNLLNKCIAIHTATVTVELVKTRLNKSPLMKLPHTKNAYGCFNRNCLEM